MFMSCFYHVKWCQIFIMWNKTFSGPYNSGFPQKQPFRGTLRKKCSENMHQIYRRRPMPKCKATLFAITLRHWCSPVNLQHIFRTPFPKNTSGGLLLFSHVGIVIKLYAVINTCKIICLVLKHCNDTI